MIGVGRDVGAVDSTADGRLLQKYAGEDSIAANPHPVFHA